MSSAVETGDRVALPLRLHEHMASLGNWMKLLGIAQAVGSIGGLFIGAFAAMTLVTAGAGGAAIVLGVLTLLLALFFRQALLLLAAADHFAETASDVDSAHEHVVLAFERLRPVFVIDAAIAMCMITAFLIGGVI